MSLRNKICKKWSENKSNNPLTKRKIKHTSPIRKILDHMCENMECDIVEKGINPITRRKLKNTSTTLQLLKQICEKEIPEAKKKADEAKTSEKECVYVQPLQCTLYKTVELRAHQKQVCNYLKNHPKQKGMVLFHSVGSGKTLTAITMIRCILEKNPKKEIFVTTPTSLVDNFKKELDKVQQKFGQNVKLYSHGTFVNKIVEHGANFCKDAVIIIDEAHNFKTQIHGGKKPTGQNAKTLMKATRKASNVYLLTATPVQNNPTEFVNLYAMISNNEDQVQKLYKEFAEYSAAKLSSILKNKISYFKSEKTEDYPSVTQKDVQFYMTPTYYKLYKEVEENNIGMKNIFQTKDLVKFLNGVRRAVNNIDDSVTTPKVEWALEHIKKQDKSNRKVLVYSNWINSGLRLIQKRLDDMKISWEEVNGSMTAKKRKDAVKKYNENNVNVLFISTAGGEGLDLKGTRSVIIMESHWNNEKLKQIIGRAVRYKSHEGLPPKSRHVDVYQLILKKPLRNEDKLESADDMLKKLSDKKDKIIRDFYKSLINASI